MLPLKQFLSADSQSKAFSVVCWENVLKSSVQQFSILQGHRLLPKSVLGRSFFSQKVMSKQKPHLTRLIGMEVDDDEEVSIMCDQETG